MLVDALLQHEVEGQVNRMVENVRGLEIKQEVAEGSQGSSRGNGGGGGVPDFATIIAQQLQNLLPTIVAQVENHVNNQGNNKNQDDNVTNDNNQGNVRNMNNGQGGCSYKEFMACNPKDYDGKGGAIVYTRWIEKVESTRGWESAVGMTWEDFKTLTREEFCSNNEMQKLKTKFWCHVMVGAGHVAYTDRFYELARLIRAMVAATEPTRIQSVVLKAGMLTDEAIRNGSLKKNTEKRGNSGESSRDGNTRDDNKISRIGRAFATITNPVRKEVWPRVVNPLNARNPTAARGACFECGGTDHYNATCPRLNRAPRPGGNRPNQVMHIKGGQGRGNNDNQARGRAFMMGAEEARQDPNIVSQPANFKTFNYYFTL
ncbi:hypothetical protein Tco_1563161 [Tanacetum coccineum]